MTTTYEITAYDNNGHNHEATFTADSIRAMQNHVARNYRAGLGSEFFASALIEDENCNMWEVDFNMGRNEWSAC